MLYKRLYNGTLLRCLIEREVEDILSKIHEGSYGNHMGGKSLAHKVLRQGYFWPHIYRDAKQYAQKYDKCQRFAYAIYIPAEECHSISSLWPFLKWGIGIVGPLPMAIGQKKFLLITTYYFLKWIEVKALAHICATKNRNLPLEKYYLKVQHPNRTTQW